MGLVGPRANGGPVVELPATDDLQIFTNYLGANEAWPGAWFGAWFGGGDNNSLSSDVMRHNMPWPHFGADGAEAVRGVANGKLHMSILSDGLKLDTRVPVMGNSFGSSLSFTSDIVGLELFDFRFALWARSLRQGLIDYGAPTAKPSVPGRGGGGGDVDKLVAPLPASAAVAR